MGVEKRLLELAVEQLPEDEVLAAELLDLAYAVKDEMVPKTTVRPNFTAVTSGITDLFEALQNILECLCAASAMQQEPKWSDMETIVASVYAIASRYYHKLPVDLDGKPVCIGDEMETRPGEHYTVVAVSDDRYFTRDANGEYSWWKAAKHRHVCSEDPLGRVLADVRAGLVSLDEAKVIIAGLWD